MRWRAGSATRRRADPDRVYPDHPRNGESDRPATGCIRPGALARPVWDPCFPPPRLRSPSSLRWPWLGGQFAAPQPCDGAERLIAPAPESVRSEPDLYLVSLSLSGG